MTHRVPLASLPWFVGTLTPHKTPQKAQGRQLIVEPGKRNPTWGFEVLWPVSKQHWSKEGKAKNFPGLSCTSEIFHCTFCVLFSKTGRAGEPHVCNIWWLYNPACVRGNEHPEHPDCSHVLISGQDSWRPWNWDGKTMEKHGVQGTALSWVMGKLLCCISGLAWHKCFYLVALLSCQSHNVILHSNTSPKTIIISDLPTMDVHCLLNISAEATVTVNRLLHKRGYQIFTQHKSQVRTVTQTRAAHSLSWDI